MYTIVKGSRTLRRSNLCQCIAVAAIRRHGAAARAGQEDDHTPHKISQTAVNSRAPHIIENQSSPLFINIDEDIT